MLVAAGTSRVRRCRYAIPIVVAFGAHDVAEPAIVLQFPTVMAFITALKRGHGTDEPPRPRLTLVPK